MRIFDCVQPWPHKVNFIDENNVVLGYDMKSSCCENFGWFISDVAFSQIPKNIAEIEDKYGTDYTGWLFDQNFIEDGGGMKVFRISKDGKFKYIHLYNIHNGYYSHGFDFSVLGQNIVTGSI